MFACLVPLQQQHFDSPLLLLLWLCHLYPFCVTAILLTPNVKKNATSPLHIFSSMSN